MGKVKIEWSSKFAYALGLIVSDGSLSKDGRHIDFTSKDREQIENFSSALNLNNKIGIKKSAAGNISCRIQISDSQFYRFMEGIGITSAKSKTIDNVIIPSQYYSHYLRGVFDGDGYSSSYFDKRWKSSFMLYIVFCSASLTFLKNVQSMIHEHICIKGHIIKARKGNTCFELRYSKFEAKTLAKWIYKDAEYYLSRKYLKIDQSLAIVREQGKSSLGR